MVAGIYCTSTRDACRSPRGSGCSTKRKAGRRRLGLGGPAGARRQWWGSGDRREMGLRAAGRGPQAPSRPCSSTARKLPAQPALLTLRYSSWDQLQALSPSWRTTPTGSRVPCDKYTNTGRGHIHSPHWGGVQGAPWSETPTRLTCTAGHPVENPRQTQGGKAAPAETYGRSPYSWGAVSPSAVSGT